MQQTISNAARNSQFHGTIDERMHLVYDKNFADFIAFCLFSPLSLFFLTRRQIETAIFFIARRTMLDLANGIFFNGCLRDIVARVNNKFFLPFANVIQYVLRSAFGRYNDDAMLLSL